MKHTEDKFLMDWKVGISRVKACIEIRSYWLVIYIN